jgi:EAL domain-containing protein (putative c-di-GMP-specific phosphodiesterase class I)
LGDAMRIKSYVLFSHDDCGGIRLYHSRLRQAIVGDGVLLYQPKVVMWDGSVSGVEVLCRWQHPDLGCLPDDFIPVAERTGLIAPHALGLVQIIAAMPSGMRRESN